MDKNRNIHEWKVRSRLGVIDFVNSYIWALDNLAERRPTFIGDKEVWKPPEGRYSKTNFDASHDSQNHKSASRVVVRNTKWKVIVSKSRLHTKVGSTFVTEALACLEAVLTEVDMGLVEVIVEGDSRSIINKCKTSSIDKSQITAYIKDIQQEKRRFCSLIFKHTHRSAN